MVLQRAIKLYVDSASQSSVRNTEEVFGRGIRRHVCDLWRTSNIEHHAFPITSKTRQQNETGGRTKELYTATLDRVVFLHFWQAPRTAIPRFTP